MIGDKTMVNSYGTVYLCDWKVKYWDRTENYLIKARRVNHC